jgi:hypothetical protein
MRRLGSQESSMHWLAPAGGEYRGVESSRLIELGAAGLSGHIAWP